MTGSVDAQPGTAKAVASSAGAALKAAREAAGLSLDAVAQQLKLAPRQVQALEDDDYQHLPGRTFVRGFARNYARFVHLDPDAVLAMLPAAEAAPALERPTLAPTRRPMGELPVEGVARRSAFRWLIPLLLLCIVAAAGYYEYTRQQAALRAAATRSEPATGAAVAPSAVVPAPAPETTSPAPASQAAGGATASGAPPQDATTAATPATSGATPAAPGTVSTPLPNPLAGSPASAAPAATAPATAGPAQPPQPGTPAAPGTRNAPAAGGSTASGASSAATRGQVSLALAFRGRSWVEVRDASGRIVLQSTENAGATRTVSGTPPFLLALGNAQRVDVTFRGRSVDLRPYTRANVARVALK